MKRTPKSPPVDNSIRSLSHFEDSTGCRDCLDLTIEGMLSGRIATKGIIIEGPMGTGKRVVARAAAAEFGAPVAEFDPKSACTRQMVARELARIGTGGTLVINNFDDCAQQLQVELTMLMIFGKTKTRPAAVEHMMASMGDGAPAAFVKPSVIIVTTNSLGGMPPPMRQEYPIFKLRRQLTGTLAALQRKLKAAGASCSDRTLKAVGRFIHLCADDRFELTVGQLATQADRCEGKHVDDGVGERFVASCWGTLSPTELLRAVRIHAGQRRTSSRDFAKVFQMLGIPRVLRPEVTKLARQAVTQDADGDHQASERHELMVRLARMRRP